MSYKIKFPKTNRNNILNSKLKSYDNLSYRNIYKNNNYTENIKYLNFRRKLLRKCNSIISKDKKILPILSNRYNCNQFSLISSKRGKSILKGPYSAKKAPNNVGKVNFSQKKLIKIPILSPIKRRNKNMSMKIMENQKSGNLPKSKSTNKLDLNINMAENNCEENSNILNIESEEDKNTENEEKDINSNNKEKIEKLSKDLFAKKQQYKFSPFKFSKFYKLSKSRNVSAKNIYDYYISQEKKDNVLDPIDNFTKFIQKKYHNQKMKFDKLYLNDKTFLNRMEEIKSNKTIAFKEDFNVEEYQNILCNMLKKRVGSNNIFYLIQNYKKFNEKIGIRFHKYKGRYTKLADKIRNNAPSYLIDKLRKLDQDKLRENAKFLKINLNNKKDNDVDYAYEDYDYYFKNKFVPNPDDIKKLNIFL